jgi:hypothetical protein
MSPFLRGLSSYQIFNEIQLQGLHQSKRRVGRGTKPTFLLYEIVGCSEAPTYARYE